MVWVVSVGVWQKAQPTLLNRSRPRVIDAEPPGVVVEGVGGARKRMKNANRSTSEKASTVGEMVGSVFVTLFGALAKMQLPLYSRSSGNISLVMPISTL
jgi:hypothetical protein